ncbi:PP2C family protein-serine/threonine phosphatase [Streptomyces sp. A 4/2]|uniref:PP2C family protein-serine/threonine phosphatase n=1 Tax=Streptomyces sp. A 4/2 TaxID=2934314 RepID=UPI0020259FC3|nr:PP2C family protein-serine/threonine phosphatase [Streptomyces sp. A 4/2]
MLDISLLLRVHVDPLIATQNDLGVCDAIERNAPVRKPAAMSASHLPKVAGINSPVPAPAQTAAPLPAPAPDPAPGTTPGALIQDRLAGWVFDLTTLHELTERLAATSGLDEALREFLRAGAALLGARRGLVVLEPAEPNGPIGTHGPTVTVGLGLSHAELGHIETLPRGVTAYGRILDATGAGAVPVGGFADPDLRHDKTLDPRLRDVAARIGCAASYALPLASGPAGVPRPVLGAAVWFYDEPAEPAGRRRRLAGLYAQYASEHLARLVELDRARIRVATLAEELLPSRLPRVPGVQLAACHRTGPRGGGDWYDALPLPEGALGLAVGSVTGSGAGATAAMGRLRASLRAYAVMEGEDPVAVLSDLELLLRLTEPARSATVLFAYCEPARRTILLAGAGHTPPLIVGDRRTEFVETSLSAPLGMLACWEAPSAAFSPAPGETVLLCTDGLLRRTGDPMDRAFARLHSAAASVPRALLGDPAEIAGHVLRTVLPDGLDQRESPEDVVILAARFD